jgi:hypothetical protein
MLKLSCVFFVFPYIRGCRGQNLVDRHSCFSYNIYVASASKRFCRKETKGTSQQGGRVIWRMLIRPPPPYFAFSPDFSRPQRTQWKFKNQSAKRPADKSAKCKIKVRQRSRAGLIFYFWFFSRRIKSHFRKTYEICGLANFFRTH